MGKCLDVAGSSTNSGANVDLWSCNQGANQRWIYSGLQIMSASSGKCLDVAGGNTYNGANVEQWDCNGGGNQQWVLTAETSATSRAGSPKKNVGIAAMLGLGAGAVT